MQIPNSNPKTPIRNGRQTRSATKASTSEQEDKHKPQRTLDPLNLDLPPSSPPSSFGRTSRPVSPALSKHPKKARPTHVLTGSPGYADAVSRPTSPTAPAAQEATRETTPAAESEGQQQPLAQPQQRAPPQPLAQPQPQPAVAAQRVQQEATREQLRQPLVPLVPHTTPPRTDGNFPYLILNEGPAAKRKREKQYAMLTRARPPTPLPEGPAPTARPATHPAATSGRSLKLNGPKKVKPRTTPTNGTSLPSTTEGETTSNPVPATEMRKRRRVAEDVSGELNGAVTLDRRQEPAPLAPPYQPSQPMDVDEDEDIPVRLPEGDDGLNDTYHIQHCYGVDPRTLTEYHMPPPVPPFFEDPARSEGRQRWLQDNIFGPRALQTLENSLGGHVDFATPPHPAANDPDWANNTEVSQSKNTENKKRHAQS